MLSAKESKLLARKCKDTDLEPIFWEINDRIKSVAVKGEHKIIWQKPLKPWVVSKIRNLGYNVKAFGSENYVDFYEIKW
jgi:hypothetical protein